MRELTAQEVKEEEEGRTDGTRELSHEALYHYVDTNTGQRGCTRAAEVGEPPLFRSGAEGDLLIDICAPQRGAAFGCIRSC